LARKNLRGPLIRLPPDPALVWLRFGAAGAGQHSVDLVSPAISMWLILLTAAIHLLMVSIRFAVFVPIHRKLDKAKSIELIDRLLKYDIYLGSGMPASIKMIATIVMLYQVVSAP
jgi:hypothetical protein